MRMFAKVAGATALLVAGLAPLAAQAQVQTYYYCYAYGPSNQLWVSNSIRSGTQDDYAPALQGFVQSLRDRVQPSQLSASGCRPAWENSNSSAVEGDRLDFIQRERNYGKSVEVWSW